MRTRKRFGQHFLEAVWADKVIDAIAPLPEDIFLEIGPGPGILTLRLAPRVSTLIAVEIDRDLVRVLTPNVPPNVSIVNADVLDISLATLLPPARTPVRVAGNLPYNISSPILFKLLASHAGGSAIRDATLMLQREVADRLVAAPGGSDYGVLALQAALHADVQRVLTLPPGAFRPAPRVTSAVVQLRFRPPAADVGRQPEFERLVRGLFQRRRKTVQNALTPLLPADLSAAAVLTKAGIDPGRRPQTLRLDEAARLVRTVLYFSGSY